MIKDIAFVGDSYCAGLEPGRAEIAFHAGHMGWQGQPIVTPGSPCWTTELAHRLGYRVLNFGFGGQSWWHSRQMFYQHYWHNPEFDQSQLEAIVFCHTSCSRIPRVNASALWQPDLSKKEIRGLEYYYSHVYEREHAYWIRDQWFHEIARTFAHVKTVHLFCFDCAPQTPGVSSNLTAEQWSLLPGVRMCEPLIWISLGELPYNTKKQVDHHLEHDDRYNHLNASNNLHLADRIYRALTNYVPGDHSLNLQDFNLPNKNYTGWPDGQYWMD